ncbi:YdcH family protein [Mameliella alba]|uniref:YdcH family protein n=1 Tax=Mameliella alba TaxID=561184 RepID=UPI00142F81A8|nr:YdcH family protein [Mameliella alba]
MKTAKTGNPSLEARVQALRSRHAALEQDIEAEQRRPLPSMSRLRALKSRKLMLKDEMTYYSGLLQTLSSMHRGNPQGAA